MTTPTHTPAPANSYDTHVLISVNTMNSIMNDTHETETIYNVELLIKNFYDILIRTAVVQINNLLKSRAPRDKPFLQLVITGGDAFNFYFKPDRVIETHDFDMRLVPNNPEYYNTPDSYNIMLTTRDDIIDKLVNILNNETLVLSDGYKTWSPRFQVHQPDTSNFLRTCSYSFGKIYTSLIDIVPYHPNVVEIENVSTGTLKEYPDGFFRNRIIPVMDKDTGLLYVKLGYLIWDTVRMVDIARTAKIKYERDIANGLAVPNTKYNERYKYGRYIKKYMHLVESINNPEEWLKCGPLSEYYGKCITQLLERNQNYEHPSELIERGIEDSVFPSVLRSLPKDAVYTLTSDYLDNQKDLVRYYRGRIR